MPLTVGTNSYVTMADANAYFKYAIHAKSWVDASTPEKESALVTATRSLDRQNWVGSKTVDTQPLQWPRTGVIDRDEGEINPLVVPQEVIDANCELALALLDDVTVQSNADTGSNIKKLKAGSAEIEYIRGEGGTRFPVITTELIGLWLTGSSSYSGPFVSGADNETAFGAIDLTRGY